jgi:hypothetical protein
MTTTTTTTTKKKDTDPDATHQAYNAPPTPTSHDDSTPQTAYTAPAAISSPLGPSHLNHIQKKKKKRGVNQSINQSTPPMRKKKESKPTTPNIQLPTKPHPLAHLHNPPRRFIITKPFNMEHQHGRKRFDENLLLGVDGLLGLGFGDVGVDGWLSFRDMRLRLRRQRNLHSLRMRDVRQRILNSVDLIMLKIKKIKKRSDMSSIFIHANNEKIKKNKKTHLNIQPQRPPILHHHRILLSWRAEGRSEFTTEYPGYRGLCAFYLCVGGCHVSN